MIMKKILLMIAVVSVVSFSLVACDKESNSTQNNVNLADNQKIEEIQKVENTKVSENSKDEEKTNSDYVSIKFSDMYDTKGTIKNVSTTLKNLNGEKVIIKGYPAVQSPLDESFVYLNNQPYVTCPFCTIGDTTKLEVIPIFMANGSKIKYTENSLTVYGKLEVAEKVDSEGYTTQFRIYADKVEETQDTVANKNVNDYYMSLSEAGMIYDIQTLQMNVEYATNPECMEYYDEDFQTQKTSTINKEKIIKGIVLEYLDFDSQYNGNYLNYIKECPDIVEECEPEDSRLKQLNKELIDLYKKEIIILEKYQNAVYTYNSMENPTAQDAETAYNSLTAINADNLKLYNEFTAWNNKLRE